MKRCSFLLFILITVVFAGYSAAQIVIDAEKDAWYDALTGPDDGYLQIQYFSNNNNGKPDDNADLSAKFWASWDDTYLYVYEEVKDNVVNLNNATSWQDDVLEIYIDADPTGTITTGQCGFHITALDSADADPAALAGVENLTGYNLDTGSTPDDYARKRTADGYVLECRVKWDSLTTDARGPIVPAVGTSFGMAIMNHDNDVAQREGSIAWSAVLNDNVWSTPANHGAVTFLADGKLQFVATSLRDPSLVNTLPYDGTLPPIAIDAAKDPFYDTLTGPDDGYLQIQYFSNNNNGKPDDNADLSAKFWASWDDTYLYVYEEVKDNVVNLNNATSWQDDVLEIYIDADPTGAITQGQCGFHITALDSADADPAALAGVENLTGYNLDTGSTPADYARKTTSDGYVLECRVKWDSLTTDDRGPIVPAVGTSFGMAIMNHDNDVAQREGSIAWSAVLNDNVWSTPANHGAVTFLADGKLQFVATSLRDPSLVNDLPYDGSFPPIVIDANKDPFYGSLTGPSDGWLYIPAAAYNNNGAPDNDYDLSAMFWASWDDTYLYVYEEVVDNVVNLNNATSWQDDVLEIYIDADPTGAITQGQCGFHITALDSADADPAALAGVENLTGYNLDTGSTPDDYARKRTANGYVLECRVKWDSLTTDDRGPIVPAVGTSFGMAIMNHDNDATQREGSIGWSAVLNDNVWSTPANHGAVTFLADGKLQFVAASLRDPSLVNALADLYDPTGIILDVEQDALAAIPEEYSLSHNYPNPFNPSTKINYTVPTQSRVTIKVYDMLGREVATLVDENHPAGRYTVTFDGSALASGVYIYRMSSGSKVMSHKLMLIK